MFIATETKKQARLTREVKLVEDAACAGKYCVEIWIGGKPELIFHFDDLEQAQKRYEDEVQLRGY